MSTYKRNTDFVVTHSIPCPMCGELKPEKEIGKHYYGVSWDMIFSCLACLKVAEEKEAANRPSHSDIYGY